VVNPGLVEILYVISTRAKSNEEFVAKSKDILQPTVFQLPRVDPVDNVTV
jgi:hypothetical protein